MNGAGSRLLECRVADDGADDALRLQGPGAFIAVAEGDVYILATSQDDRVGVGAEDLAAVVLVLDTCAEGEFDGFEGAGGIVEILLISLVLDEGSLNSKLDSLVAEGDADLIVGGGRSTPWGGEGRCSGEEGEDAGCVLHFDRFGRVWFWRRGWNYAN